MIRNIKFTLFLQEEQETYGNTKRNIYVKRRYCPTIEINSNIDMYDIKNINNKYEVMEKVLKKLENRYISTSFLVKPIINIHTGMKIEIWKSGIRETFGNDKYYLNLSKNMKKSKIATMDSLAKLIKYGIIRSKEAKNYHNANSKVMYSYLEAPIIIDKITFKIKMDIRKSPNGQNRFYIHSLEIIK